MMINITLRSVIFIIILITITFIPISTKTKSPNQECLFIQTQSHTSFKCPDLSMHFDPQNNNFNNHIQAWSDFIHDMIAIEEQESSSIEQSISGFKLFYKTLTR